MDNYVFDKRKMKKYFKKYGAIFGAMFAIVLVLNMAMLRADVSLNLRRIFLVIFGLFFVAGVEWVLYMKRTKTADLQENKKDGKQQTVIVQNNSVKTKTKTIGKEQQKTENKNESKSEKNAENETGKIDNADKENKTNNIAESKND